MPMNRMHRKICASDGWASAVESDMLPWALSDVDLGDDVLEIGPGFGATTRVLARRPGELTALEVDEASAQLLRTEFDGRVEILHGDGASMPLPDNRFSAVVCFTMLHHVPGAERQDALFAEACRVLAPGGVFAGMDSRLSFRFRLLHFGDTMVVIDPTTLPARLGTAGFTDEHIDLTKSRLRFHARKPT